MNRKGQALVEFILVFPLLLLVLFAIIDFGLIINKKNELENKSVDIVTLLKNGKSIEEIKIIISEDVNVMTPGLNLVLGNPYRVEVERNIPNAS